MSTVLTPVWYLTFQVVKPKQGVWLSPFLKFVFTDLLVRESLFTIGFWLAATAENTSLMARQQKQPTCTLCEAGTKWLKNCRSHSSATTTVHEAAAISKEKWNTIIRSSGGSRPGVWAGGSQIRGRQKVFTCINIPSSVWQSFGITQKWLSFLGQENGYFCW